MKKHMMMFAAILCCALAFTACKKDDDTQTVKSDTTPAYVQLFFSYENPKDMVDNMDITITFNDGTGEKSEKMTETRWSRVLSSALPANFSVRQTISLKAGVTLSDDRNYDYGCRFSEYYVLYNSKKEELGTYKLSGASFSHAKKGSAVTLLVNDGDLNSSFSYNFDKSGKLTNR